MHTKVDFVHLTHEKLLNHQIYYISNIYQYPPKIYFVWNIFWPPNIFALLVAVVGGVVPVSGCRSGQRWVRAAAGGGNLSNMWRQETCCAELWPELLSVTHRASWCYLHRSAACSSHWKQCLMFLMAWPLSRPTFRKPLKPIKHSLSVVLCVQYPNNVWQHVRYWFIILLSGCPKSQTSFCFLPCSPTKFIQNANIGGVLKNSGNLLHDRHKNFENRFRNSWYN